MKLSDLPKEVLSGLPFVLTDDKLLATKRAFDGLVEDLKARDTSQGLCVCANCFGDRQMGHYRMFRRNCLELPQRLTDLGGTIGRNYR